MHQTAQADEDHSAKGRAGTALTHQLNQLNRSGVSTDHDSRYGLARPVLGEGQNTPRHDTPAWLTTCADDTSIHAHHLGTLLFRDLGS